MDSKLSYSHDHLCDQFGTIQNIQWALIPQTSNWSETIFFRFLQQTGSSNHSYKFKPEMSKVYLRYGGCIEAAATGEPSLLASLQR